VWNPFNHTPPPPRVSLHLPEFSCHRTFTSHNFSAKGLAERFSWVPPFMDAFPFRGFTSFRLIFGTFFPSPPSRRLSRGTFLSFAPRRIQKAA